MPNLSDSFIRQPAPRHPCYPAAGKRPLRGKAKKWRGKGMHGPITVTAEGMRHLACEQRNAKLARMPLADGYRKSPLQQATGKLFTAPASVRIRRRHAASDILHSLNLVAAYEPEIRHRYTLIDCIPASAGSIDNWPALAQGQSGEAPVHAGTVNRPLVANTVSQRRPHRERKGIRLNPAIPGIDDRMFYLALVAAPGTLRLRPSVAGKTELLPAVKPASRAECEQRCGKGGFCDPSSESGCGGEHCGRRQQTPAD